jgi:two-component system, NarL family, response regulator NreC
MPSNSCLVIHEMPIVQIGLRSLLNSMKSDIREMVSVCPDLRNYPLYPGLVILIDAKHAEIIRRERKYLKKQGIPVIGLSFDEHAQHDETLFDEILLYSDNQNILAGKLGRFTTDWKPGNSSNQLSTREIEILQQVAQGLSNKEISEKLFISIHTVITHRKHITAKLGIKSISGLTLYASLNNLID